MVWSAKVHYHVHKVLIGLSGDLATLYSMMRAVTTYIFVTSGSDPGSAGAENARLWVVLETFSRHLIG